MKTMYFLGSQLQVPHVFACVEVLLLSESFLYSLISQLDITRIVCEGHTGFLISEGDTGFLSFEGDTGF